MLTRPKGLHTCTAAARRCRLHWGGFVLKLRGAHRYLWLWSSRMCACTSSS